MNAWEDKIKAAEGMESAVDFLISEYDYFYDYLDDNGSFNFEIETNFDTASQEF
jgi:hypothetical protein